MNLREGTVKRKDRRLCALIHLCFYHFFSVAGVNGFRNGFLIEPFMLSSKLVWCDYQAALKLPVPVLRYAQWLWMWKKSTTYIFLASMSICLVNWPIPLTHSFVQASIQTRDLLTLYSGLSGHTVMKHYPVNRALRACFLTCPPPC